MLEHTVHGPSKETLVFATVGLDYSKACTSWTCDDLLSMQVQLQERVCGQTLDVCAHPNLTTSVHPTSLHITSHALASYRAAAPFCKPAIHFLLDAYCHSFRQAGRQL